MAYSLSYVVRFVKRATLALSKSGFGTHLQAGRCLNNSPLLFLVKFHKVSVHYITFYEFPHNKIGVYYLNIFLLFNHWKHMVSNFEIWHTDWRLSPWAQWYHPWVEVRGVFMLVTFTPLLKISSVVPNWISLTKLSSKHPNVIFCNKEWYHMRFYETMYNVLPVFREKIYTKCQQGYPMYCIFLGNRAAKQEIWPCLRNCLMYRCQMQYNDFAPLTQCIIWLLVFCTFNMITSSCHGCLAPSSPLAATFWPLLFSTNMTRAWLDKIPNPFFPLPGLSSYLMNH